MASKYYSLTILGNEILLDCTVDDKTLTAFEKTFKAKKGWMVFVDKKDKGKVILKSEKLTGYKKTLCSFIPLDIEVQ